MKITYDDVEDLARGAAFLGAGGGGDPYVGALMLRQVLGTGAAVELLDVEDLPDQAVAVPFAMMGAPTVLVEKVPNGEEGRVSLRALEHRLGLKADAILCAEIGGINALLPLVLGAKLGLPVVDGDGMGRAFPALQMLTYHIFGIPAAPMTMVDEHLNLVTIESTDANEVERIGRHVVVAMGGVAHICLYAMSGRDAKRSLVRGTLSMALALGRLIRTARAASLEPQHAILDYLRTTPYYNKCCILFEGKCVDLLRETRSGWTLGRLRMEGTGKYATRTLEIQFQNEHLIAREESRIRAVVPDLIAVVDASSAEPVTTDGLKYGQRLVVFGISAAPIMRIPEALVVFGPQAFGLDVPFTPVELLNPES